MKRFIRYLYEYEHGKRIRNVGFVKVEAGNEETTLHMQGKGFHQSGDRKLALYLFYEENGNLIGIHQADLELNSPMMSCQLRYTPGDTGMPENYSKILGILLETESGRRIAATWDDRTVDVDHLVMWERDISDAAGHEEAKEGRDAPEMKDNAPAESRKIIKIQRQDIARLPRCEWKLANNRFLMHGYNNYRHLVLIQSENNWKLGVPGIYHINEARLAESFGFGEFLPIEEVEISLNKEERHQDEPFGYWCRNVRKGDR